VVHHARYEFRRRRRGQDQRPGRPAAHRDRQRQDAGDIANGTWDTFLTTYARAVAGYHSTIAIDFDLLIVETGAEPGKQRMAQIDSLFAGLKATPQIVGFIWFNYDKGPGHEWALQRDAAALAAFHEDAVSYQGR
jgi:hypothetical protein